MHGVAQRSLGRTRPTHRIVIRLQQGPRDAPNPGSAVPRSCARRARVGVRDAAFDALTSTVWYDYAPGTNAKSSRAIDEPLRAEPRLGDATMAGLCREVVSDPAEHARCARARRTRAGDLGHGRRRRADRRRDAAVRRSLARARATAVLEPAIGGALASAREMQDSAIVLRHQVATGPRGRRAAAAASRGVLAKKDWSIRRRTASTATALPGGFKRSSRSLPRRTTQAGA
jgi:hypothetical protein